MATFAEQLEVAAGAEEIEAVVIGHIGWHDDDDLGRPAPYKEVVLLWPDARESLNYEYDSGYGGVDCHAVYCWTASKVIFVSQYDGSTCVTSVPRNPTPGLPEMPGG